MNALFLLTLALPLRSPPVQDSAVFEDFDARGTSWAATIFPNVEASPNMGVSREPLSVDQGAPDTEPPLPINAGGDAEGRFCEEVLPASGSFALSAISPANVMRNGSIRAVVAFGVTDPFGSQIYGVLLRARINPNPPFGSGLNAYTAYIYRSGAIPGEGNFVLARWQDGVVSSQFVLTSFALGAGPENYVIEFEVEGRRLAARLWRITARDGSLVTEPVALANGLGPLANQIEAQDGSLITGRAGMYAFTRSTNSVFCDDILVKRTDDRRHQSTGVTPFGMPGGPRLLPWTIPWELADLLVALRERLALRIRVEVE